MLSSLEEKKEWKSRNFAGAESDNKPRSRVKARVISNNTT
jgi:hypothetical protein